ncbi:MAG: hypothetical protein EWV49_13660 [Microcystis aeruginosa Ma_QC_Ch_20071001_S25]|jgi:hypothetical protein|uniref:Uncharacterized protein n=1 Tax=Microcystis aeruginosa Ma_QC_Ch_20071001_S25D TaxID=2486250 RepID=A0A552G4U0_MICAE|nr:MAG: hypothetical protein EWV49_13660 [Microcystis aeruginosa Ma_QC_Ch_20071001_S25]TRU53994.1 MAG: hypothetical protein EWV57_02735 [Microcystis aeruginosa Ma_QC_Ch_20071001_S25D]TRU59869.1 MAG: hypothetical protein EWV90_16215 [Microcystis aeruginosa Ma_QC_Ch_20071001_M135]
MVYLRILCNLILIFTVFEPSKINYARGLINYTYLNTSCLLPLAPCLLPHQTFALIRELS